MNKNNISKKLALAALTLWFLQTPAQAQNDQQRSTATKIADVLAMVPARDEIKLNDVFKQLESFSPQDITALFLQLKPPGGDNARIEYASNSYAYYVMLPGKESQREKFVQGAVAALQQLQDRDNKGYVINMLINAGKDDAVPALKPFLTDDYLADRAAKTLARIGTETAGAALYSELNEASGKPKIAIVTALGDAAYVPANEALIELTTSADTNLRKVSFYSLARLAQPTSLPTFEKALKDVDYHYDESNITANYLVYLNHLIKAGQKELAEKQAKKLLAQAKDQTPVRIAALSILTAIKGEAAEKDLKKAIRDRNVAYSAAAFKLAMPFVDQENAGDWLKASAKAPAPAQAIVINTIGGLEAENLFSSLQKSLSSKDPGVRKASIIALSKIDPDKALDLLIPYLDKADSADREAIELALNTSKSDQLTAKLTEATSKADGKNKALLLSVLGERNASEAYPLTEPALSDDNPEVRKAAYWALPYVSRAANLDALTERLVASTSDDEVKALQQSIVMVVSASDVKEQNLETLLKRYASAAPEKQALLLPVFAGIGEGKALEPVREALKGNAQIRAAAVSALAAWKDSGALSDLIQLSRSSKDPKEKDAILKGMVRLISSSELPADQKVLLLRDAMEVAENTQQKRMILSSLAANKTYNALVFSGKFLDNSELRSAAAMSVLNIALDNPDLYGPQIREILSKAVDALSGNDSDYLKQALIKHINELPKAQGFVPLFNEKDLTGWKGLVADPIKRSKMSQKELNAAQAKADEQMRAGWLVKDGVLWFNGKGDNIATTKDYGDFEMLVDWKLSPVGKDGDAGIYLRGTPQVQIWDTSRVNVGAQVGSGGLYNNEKNESKPLKVADNVLGEWNTFRILMKGDQVTVYLNGELVTDNVALENYWDRSQPIFPSEQIELQAHGTEVAYRDIYIRELPRKEVFTLSDAEKKEGFQVLFDGTDMNAWTGNTDAYTISEEGTLAIFPTQGSGGNLYTKEEFGDFTYRLEFRLTPGANNGVGVRTPMEGDAAYEGIEIQLLDDGADIYKDIKPYQFTGSVYGVIPAKSGHLNPVGEWNKMEITYKGDDVKVVLNDATIVNGNLKQASKSGTVDGREHPGLKRSKGHLAFLGHGSEVHFRNLRVKKLDR